MKTIRWGIIGCGDVCERKSGPPLYQLPDSKLVAVTCRSVERGNDFATRHGCRYHADIATLLADEHIDVVYVATPDAHHHQHTLAALVAGKNVMVEKPMASNTAQCNEMITAAETTENTLAVAYYRRCYPSILKIQSLLAEDAIGTVKRMWINDQFPTSHRLDLCHFFFGPVIRARVFEGPLPPDSAADAGLIVELEHAKGIISAMGVAWRENHDIEQIIIDGTEGRIVLSDLKAGRLSLVKEWDCTNCDQPPLPYPHWGLMDNMNQHLRDPVNNPLACDGIAGRQSTVIEDFIATVPADGQWQPVVY